MLTEIRTQNLDCENCNEPGVWLTLIISQLKKTKAGRGRTAYGHGTS